MPSDNKAPQNNNSGKHGSPQRFQPKVLLIYLVIVAAILTIWFANPGTGSNVKSLSISELVQNVKAGKIAEGDGFMEPDPSFGRDGYVITGQMHSLLFKFAPPGRKIVLPGFNSLVVIVLQLESESSFSIEICSFVSRIKKGPALNRSVDRPCRHCPIKRSSAAGPKWGINP